jgi:hypothetical protein
VDAVWLELSVELLVMRRQAEEEVERVGESMPVKETLDAEAKGVEGAKDREEDEDVAVSITLRAIAWDVDCAAFALLAAVFIIAAGDRGFGACFPMFERHERRLPIPGCPSYLLLPGPKPPSTPLFSMNATVSLAYWVQGDCCWRVCDPKGHCYYC